ncbi:MAG: glucokinase [Xanthomonadaceae bacterium]|nr:glucokinase [Xanthomonadaceae bacterium]
MTADAGCGLVADIGGTNIRFALVEPQAAAPLLRDSIHRYRVADYPSLGDAARRYLDDTGARVSHAVCAAAGRITAGEVRLTNHPWLIRVEETRATLGLASMRVVNDFAAMSRCLPLLLPDAVVVLGAATAPAIGATTEATYAVIGPGTGLGVGALLKRARHFDVLETEGGHVAFAPQTDEEIEILRVLRARYGRVSNERLISGSGLPHLHQALCELSGTQCERLPPEAITAAAAAGSDALCVRTLEVFAAILGSVAGDLVLTLGAWDGLYLAGGLLPRLLPWLQRGAFRARFEDKGRFGESLRRVPSVAIMDPDAGLLGAAALAVQYQRVE